MKKNLYEAENGKLSGLISLPGGDGNKLNSEAAAAYNKMVDAAKKEKITWSITDSYRTLETQKKIFDWGFFKRTGKRRKLGTSGTPVAYPGTSNHGWGSAVDLDVKYGDEAHKWLTDNAHKFGFSNPFKNKRTEPWHWEHVESANKMKSGAKLVEPEIDGGEIDNGLETPKSGSKSEIESSLFGDSSLEASNDESSYGLVNTFIDMVTHKENVELKDNILSEEIKRIKQLLK